MAVVLYCPHCGERNPARARFCNACGGGVRPDPQPIDPGPPPPDLLPLLHDDAGAAQAATSVPTLKLLWWTVPADSLLHRPSFRALMGMRVASETAINALGYGMLVQVVRETQSGFAAALVTVSTVAPAALFGVIGGAVVDRSNKRLMLVAANVVRALICIAFLFTTRNALSIYALLVTVTVASQLATPAESSIIPQVVEPPRLAAANSFANLCEAAGQLLGMAILAPIFVKVTGDAGPLVLVCALIFGLAALRALAIRMEVASEEPRRRAGASGVAAARPWLAGTRESLAEAWSYLASNRAAFITLLLLVLASIANLVMVTLAPRFTQQVLALDPEFSVFVFGPAVVGMLSGLAIVPRATRMIRPRVLVLLGFFLMVAALLAMGVVGPITRWLTSLNLLGVYDPGPLGRGPLAHSDNQLGTVMCLAVPLGFSFSVVQVAANTFMNERIPLAMQGRIFALQGAIKNAAAIVPLLALGGLASLVGVRPVLIVAPLLILFFAIYGASKSARLAAGRRRDGGVEGRESGVGDGHGVDGHGSTTI